MKLKPWLKLFRLPNLPTAPGDAWAGAAFFLPYAQERLPQAMIAGVCALLLYMFGLADNDIVGAKTDGTERPIPAGDISLTAAKFMRGLLLVSAFALGAIGDLGRGWTFAAVALVLSVMTYNRYKSKWFMGFCRGLSVACGIFAVQMPTALVDSAAPLLLLTLLVLGWTGYIAAVTKLSEGEERPSDGLGRIRYFGGLAAFIPCGACFFLPHATPAILPFVGSLFTYLAWCVAVAPLGEPHEPALRRRSVGATIGALLYMQIGFMLVEPRPEFTAAAVAVWLATRIVRRLAPTISGS